MAAVRFDRASGIEVMSGGFIIGGLLGLLASWLQRLDDAIVDLDGDG